MTSIRQRVLLSWSSGKDSAWSLHLLRQDPDIEVVGLITTFNGAANRVAMHSVRRDLVQEQAQRAGLPLWSVDLPWPCSNAIYEDLMQSVYARAAAARVTAVAFGDLFLQDIRVWREQQMESTGLAPMFPVWQIPTMQLAQDLVRAGVKARVTCIDLAKLDASFAGREYDAEFLRNLPPGIDPCGENGEFHTFVYDAPMFSQAIDVEAGETLERDGFLFADLLARSADSAHMK
jgi:uncharacterized protein (TIGR00290 family)